MPVLRLLYYLKKNYFHTPVGTNYWNVLFSDAHVDFIHISLTQKAGEKYTYDRRYE